MKFVLGLIIGIIIGMELMLFVIGNLGWDIE